MDKKERAAFLVRSLTSKELIMDLFCDAHEILGGPAHGATRSTEYDLNHEDLEQIAVELAQLVCSTH